MKLKKQLMLVALLVAGGFGLQAGLQHRKSELTLTVTDQTGNPVEQAEVSVDMVNPSFRWGTAVNAFKIVPDPFTPRADGDTEYDEKVVEVIQTFFNSVTFENRMKWGPWENYVDERYPGEDYVLEAVNAALNLKAFNGTEPFRMRGHATLWQRDYAVPQDVRNSFDEAHIRERIGAHIERYHQTFAGRITVYDLFNEPFHETLLIDRLYTNEQVAERIAEYADWFKKAQEADPNARLFINEYNILNDWTGDLNQIHSYKNLVDALRDAGAPIAGIGL